MDLDRFAESVESMWAGSGTEAARVLLVGLKALAVIVLAVLAGRFAKRQVVRSLGRPTIDRNIAALAANLAVTGIYILAVSLILAILGASWSGLLTVVGAGTIAIGLSLQDLLKSYIAGVYLLLERPFAVGDRIRIKDVDGIVEGVELRTTILRTVHGEQVIVPNATIFLEIVTNRSTSRDERTTVILSKVDVPLDELPQLVTAALSGLAGETSRPPKVELLSATAEGATISATLFHPPDHDLTAAMLTRLRESFPTADLAVGQG